MMTAYRAPIDVMLDRVEWSATGRQPNPSEDDIPYATHTGVLDIMGVKLECARLSNGQAVFYGEAIEEMVAALREAK